MTATADVLHESSRAPQHVGLPPRIRVLFVTGPERPAGRLAEALAADSSSEVSVEEAGGMMGGVTRLGDEAFDAVIVSHEPPEVDAFELVEAFRAAGCTDQPVVVLGAVSEREMTAPCYESGAEAYVCVDCCTARSLLWTVARAIEYHRLAAECRRLQQAEMQRRRREKDDASRLLNQQRSLLGQFDAANDDPRSPEPPNSELPPQLIDDYRELLRTFVIMGSGSMGNELERLVGVLLTARRTAQDAMRLHLQVLEEMVRGLGSRSARHVMSRADVLVLETMIRLSDGYRQMSLESSRPPRQLLFPGFDK